MAAHQTEALFGDLFRDLAIAGRALSAYPRRHPAVADGLAKAHAALSALLAATGPIEMAAARDAILWSDQRFTSPTATQLAKLLRRRRAAGLLLDPDPTVQELETFLRALAVDARAARAAGSLAAELTAAGLVRIRVSDSDFSSLSLVETDEDAVAPEVGDLAERVVRRLVANGTVSSEHLTRWIASGRTAAELLRVILDGEARAPRRGMGPGGTHGGAAGRRRRAACPARSRWGPRSGGGILRRNGVRCGGPADPSTPSRHPAEGLRDGGHRYPP